MAACAVQLLDGAVTPPLVLAPIPVHEALTSPGEASSARLLALDHVGA